MFSLIFKLICAWFAFFLPCFATYKVLSTRPINDAELERVSKYWTIIGAWVAAEYTAGWIFSWLPFYWEIKTVALLFLSLPQTQGSTWVYDMYLQPFFAANERNIDAGIGQIQSSLLSFVQARFAAIWDIIVGISNKQAPAGQPPAPGSGQPGAPQGGLNPQALMGLWNTYGPALISAVSKGKQDPAAAPGGGTPAGPSARSVGTPQAAAPEPGYVHPPALSSLGASTPPALSEPSPSSGYVQVDHPVTY